MARLRRIMAKGETVVLRFPTAIEQSQRAILWGLGLPILALEIPHLFGFYYPDGDSFWLAIKLLVMISPVFMLLQYWRHRLRIVITERRILVRRGISWRRHGDMNLRDISMFDYNPVSRTLLLYGRGRVLEIPCDTTTRSRIIVAIADSV